jgi:hypothetical protein
MDFLTHLLVWLALIASGLWLLSFWPRWVAADLNLPERAFLMRPWSRGIAPYRERWPLISWAFYGYLWTRGRALEFVIAVIVFYMVSRAASAFFKTAAAVVRSQS